MVRTVLRSIHIAGALTALTLAVLGTSGCSLFMLGNLGGSKQDDPEAIPFSGEQLTLAWDPPPSAVVSYRLSYRIHGTSAWSLLAEIAAAASPEYTIDHAELGDGEFDFGVVAVAEDEAQSAMHTSLDRTAQPECGWYLRWVN